MGVDRLDRPVFTLTDPSGTRFLYAGRFRDEHSAQLIALAEHFVAVQAQSRAQRQRLAFLMVEAYQNIIRHRHAEAGGGCSFQFQDLGEEQRIAAINPVSGAQAAALRDRLAELAQVSQERLKQLYLAGLAGGKREGQRGAGLGLIEMKRRSGRELIMDTRQGPVGGGRLLLLMVQCGSNGDPDEARSRSAWAMHDTAHEAGVLLHFQGGAGGAVQLALVRMLDLEIEDDPLARRLKQALLAFFSLARRAGEAPVIQWSLMRSVSGWVMECGADLPETVRLAIMEHWAVIAQLAKTERRERFKEVMRSGLEPAQGALEADVLELMHTASELVWHQAPDIPGWPAFGFRALFIRE